MIRGVHTMFYSSEPEELRAFLRDKLGFPFTDVGDGWLIFDLPEADMGCHPAAADEQPADSSGGEAGGEAGDEAGNEAGDGGHGAPAGTHDVSFYCDDIEATMAELEAKGVEFTSPVVDAGFGLITRFRMPGGVEVQLYEPRYTKGDRGGRCGSDGV